MSAWAAITKFHRDFPGSPEVKTLPCNAGDGGSIAGFGTKILQAGSGWGGVGRVSRRLALELQGEERLVQGNNFIIFEC